MQKFIVALAKSLCLQHLLISLTRRGLDPAATIWETTQ